MITTILAACGILHAYSSTRETLQYREIEAWQQLFMEVPMSGEVVVQKGFSEFAYERFEISPANPWEESGGQKWRVMGQSEPGPDKKEFFRVRIENANERGKMYPDRSRAAVATIQYLMQERIEFQPSTYLVKEDQDGFSVRVVRLPHRPEGERFVMSVSKDFKTVKLIP